VEEKVKHIECSELYYGVRYNDVDAVMQGTGEAGLGGGGAVVKGDEIMKGLYRDEAVSGQDRGVKKGREGPEDRKCRDMWEADRG